MNLQIRTIHAMLDIFSIAFYVNFCNPGPGPHWPLD